MLRSLVGSEMCIRDSGWTASMDSKGRLDRHLVVLVPSKGILEAWRAPFGERTLHLVVGAGCSLLHGGSPLGGMLTKRNWDEAGKAHLLHARGHILEFAPSHCTISPSPHPQGQGHCSEGISSVDHNELLEQDASTGGETRLGELLRALEGSATEAGALKIMRRIEQTHGPSELGVVSPHLAPLTASLGKAVQSISASAALQGTKARLPHRLIRLVPVLLCFRHLQFPSPSAPALAEEDTELPSDEEEWSDEDSPVQDPNPQPQCTLTGFMTGMIALLDQTTTQQIQGDAILAVDALFRPVVLGQTSNLLAAVSAVAPHASSQTWLADALGFWLKRAPHDPRLGPELTQAVAQLSDELVTPDGMRSMLTQIGQMCNLGRAEMMCKSVGQALSGEWEREWHVASRKIADLRVVRRCWRALGLDCSGLCLHQADDESISSLVARAQLAMKELQEEKDLESETGEDHAEAAVAISEMLTQFAYCTSSDLLAAHRARVQVRRWEKDPDQGRSSLLDAQTQIETGITSDIWRQAVAATIFWEIFAPRLRAEMERLEGEDPACLAPNMLSGCCSWIALLTQLHRTASHCHDTVLTVQHVGVSENELTIWSVHDDQLFQAVQNLLRSRNLLSHPQMVAILVLARGLEAAASPSVSHCLPLTFPAPAVHLLNGDDVGDVLEFQTEEWCQLAVSILSRNVAVGAAVTSLLGLSLRHVQLLLVAHLYSTCEEAKASEIGATIEDRAALAALQLDIARARLRIIFTKMKGTPHASLLAHVPADVYRWILASKNSAIQLDDSRPLSLAVTSRLLAEASNALPPRSEEQVRAAKAAQTVEVMIQKARSMIRR
eukprot:TRINITY_DN24691_c0_g1_i1.p1 TRINITY_DN24691_c0_g1~~TRINITY_DN24691_c0_g1_i1.p1  ORF type:complete len:874 (-),score=201.29 TRINITY_DN24691_c0_g1_i1:222-2738(-)